MLPVRCTPPLPLLAAALLIATVASASGAQQPAERRPTVNLHGTVFGHYLYRTDEAGRGINRFDIERAELDVRGSLAERSRYRLTIDVIPPPPTVPGGAASSWVMRARFAFLEHDVIRAPAQGFTLSGRIGMIPNVVISQQEAFWPRWVHRSPVDRAGYFASGDLGAGLLLTLPNRWGTAYATVVNGQGIGSPEVDRYKDVAARLSLTPFARGTTPFLRNAAFTVWGSDGALGSRFVAGGPGQVGPVDESHRRDRWGVHLGVREPVLLAGLAWSSRMDEVELGANTPEDPRRVEERTTDMVSVHAHLRPARLWGADGAAPLGILARVDRATGFAAADFLLAGVTWDLADRTAVGLIFQSQQPRTGSAVPRQDAWLAQFTFGF